MESEKIPLPVSQGLCSDYSSPNIIEPEIIAEVPEPIQPLQGIPNISVLPPIILADVRYNFPDASPILTRVQIRKLTLIIMLARRISWLSVFDCIFISFILYYGIPYLIFIVIILPILGFFTSKKYNRGLGICYLIYSVFIIAGRAVLIFLKPEIPSFTVQGIIIVLELFLIYFIFKFIKQLKTLNQVEKSYLMGQPRDPQGVDNPTDSAVKIISDPPIVYQYDFSVMEGDISNN